MGCCTSDSTTQKENQQTKILEIEKKINEEEYLKLIQENIKRVQIIMSSYNKTDDIDIDDDENIDTTDSNHPKKKYFRFYIIFQLTLGKLRALIEDHLAYKNNKKGYRKGSEDIDFSSKTFDISLAKNYFDSLLNTEIKHNRKDLQQLEKDMVKNVFIEEINLNI